MSLRATCTRALVIWLLLCSCSCSLADLAGKTDPPEDTDGADLDAGQGDLPKGLPSFCRAYVECCRVSFGEEVCDSILESLAASAPYLSLEQQRQACSGCTLPDACSEQDTLTVERLRTAKDAISAGETDSRLTPSGCIEYHAWKDGTTRSESLSLSRGKSGKRAAFEATYEDREANVTLELDDKPTWKASAIANAEGALKELKLEESKPSGEFLRRDVYATKGADRLSVATEVLAKSGQLQALGEFETDVAQAAFGPQPAGVSTVSCSEDQAHELKEMLESVVVEGFKCLDGKDRGDMAMFVLSTYLSRKIAFSCEAKGKDPLIAQIAIMARFTSWLFGEFSITINTDRFFAKEADGTRSLSEMERKNVLFHELLHLYFGAHQPSLGGPRQTEIDRTYACAGTCFQLDDVPTTKCGCATCLNTDICDERCGEFKDCDPDMGGSCNALPPKWFPSALECAESCTANCQVHDVSCEPCN